jgi:hypothetical protein
LAVKETGAALAGTVVETRNVALDAPAGIARGDGTEATPGLELTRVMLTPPGGAGPFRNTFPLTLAPPWINAGTVTAESDGGMTVMG